MNRQLISLLGLALAAFPMIPHAAVPASGDSLEAPQVGALTGEVTARENGEPVADAEVRVIGGDMERKTNAEGLFTLELPEGTYELTISHPEFGERHFDAVRITAGLARRTSYVLGREPDSGAIEEVVAVAKYTPGTSLDAERDTDAVLDIISSRDIAITGDSSAAAALSRVTGLTLADGKFIYVRGLGERYSSTLFNGGQLPSPDPTRRVVPLDLFPAGILEGVEVQKSYSADQPAEFGGGTVMLKTKKVPEGFFWKIGVSTGFRSGTTGDDALSYDGGGNDAFGFDDGSRDLPALISQFESQGRQVGEQNLLFPQGLSEAELEQVGESFPVNYDVGSPQLVASKSISPDVGLSASVGNRFDMDDGGSWGFQLAFDFSNQWLVREESRANYTVGGNGLQANDVSTLQLTRNDIDLSGFAVLGWEPNDFNTLSYTFAMLRQSQDDTEYSVGSNRINATDRREFELEWIERQLLSHQFEGSHLFEGFEANWLVTYSRAERIEPDQRNYVYEGDNGAFIFSTRADGNQRKWEDLQDDALDSRVDFVIPMDFDWASQFDIKTGLAYLSRERNSEIRRFTFQPGDNPALITTTLLSNESLEDILNPTFIDPDIFQLRDSTRSTDTYSADQQVAAGYLVADWFLDAPWRLTAGVRIEDNSQEVTTFELFNPENRPIIAENNTTDVLPSLSATWYTSENSQYTFALSQTLSRPDLKELSEAPYTDNLRDREVVGNPDLETTSITNLDLRFQHFWSSTENFSAALFYKDFDKPIEFIQRPSTDTIVTLANARSATLYGLEVEARKQLDFISESMVDFFASTNLALIDSEISLEPSALSVNTNIDRELQGQSPWVFNLQLGWEHPVRDESAVLLFNTAGKRISEVGVFGAPDIYEQPVAQLDFTYKRAFADNWKVSVKLDNLLDAEYEFTQGEFTTRAYENGRRIAVGISYEGF